MNWKNDVTIMFPNLTAKLENGEKQVLLTNGKQKKNQSRNLKFVFTVNFRARFLSEKKETLKLKIDQNRCINMFFFNN